MGKCYGNARDSKPENPINAVLDFVEDQDGDDCVHTHREATPIEGGGLGDGLLGIVLVELVGTKCPCCNDTCRLVLSITLCVLYEPDLNRVE